MKISYKLILLTALSALAMLILSIVSYSGLQKQQRAMENIYQVRFYFHKEGNKILNAMLRINSDVYKVFNMIHAGASWEEVKGRRDIIDKNFKSMSKMASDLKQFSKQIAGTRDAGKVDHSLNGLTKKDLSDVQLLSEISSGVEGYKSAAGEVLAMIAEGDTDMGAMLMLGAEEIFGELEGAITAITQRAESSSDISFNSAVNSFGETISFFAYTIFLALLVTLIASFLITRSITRPLASLRFAAEKMTQGRYDQHIETTESKRRDEIGDLATHFLLMRDAIKSKIYDLEVINKTGNRLNKLKSSSQVFHETLKVISEHLKFEEGAIYSVENEKSKIKMFERYGEHQKLKKKILIDEENSSTLDMKNEIVQSENLDAFLIQGKYNSSDKNLILILPFEVDSFKYIMIFLGRVEVEYRKENLDFVKAIAKLSNVTIKNIYMLNTIEDQNKNLEKKVEERTAELRKKNEDIKAILINIHQGIFTFYKDKLIHDEYSSYLETILMKSDLTRRKIDILFDKCNITSDQIDRTMATLGNSIGEHQLNFELNEHLLVKEIERCTKSGIQHLEIDWNPIFGEDNIINRMMVVVRDVTELKALQQQASKKEVEMKIVEEILNISSTRFMKYMESSKKMVAENYSLIKKGLTLKKLPQLYRNMHTIKGNSRIHNFELIAEKCHDAESRYSRYMNAEEKYLEKSVLDDLNEVIASIDQYQSVFDSKLKAFSKDNSPTEELKNVIISEVKEVIEGIDYIPNQSSNKFISSIKGIIEIDNTLTLQEMLMEELISIDQLASDLGKANVKVVIENSVVRFKQYSESFLRNVFVHILRNSVDHGIESSKERMKKGKSTVALIRIDVKLNHGLAEIHVYDDGSGLNLDIIKKKALKAQLIDAEDDLSPDEIANLIFHSGFSTKDDISEVSGRGVGMEAVKSFLEEQGGNISIQFLDNLHTESIRPFKLVVKIPSKHFIIDKRLTLSDAGELKKAL